MKKQNSIGLSVGGKVLPCFLITLVSLSASCTKYLIVDSRLVGGTHAAEPAEVTPTPAYSQMLKGLRKVALSAPDSCAEQTAAGASGMASPSGTILQTECGVEMSELERALTKAGYQVASWNAIKNMVSHENITPVAASSRLGARVLFQINSLEKSIIRTGQDARWERNFFLSDKLGTRLGGATVDDRIATSLEELVRPDEANILGEKLLSATINASAVDVETGQAIWFYQGTKAEEESSDRSTSVFAECSRRNYKLLGRACLKSTPRSIAARNNYTIVERSGGIEAVSLTGRPADEENAIYYKLVRGLIEHLVGQFASAN